ncbi:hypothetical protein BgiMline_020539 [Biomphalaria glabrata]|nr:hypothetical protein BgiMline_017745 [Biomphalaria glabrata]
MDMGSHPTGTVAHTKDTCSTGTRAGARIVSQLVIIPITHVVFFCPLTEADLLRAPMGVGHYKHKPVHISYAMVPDAHSPENVIKASVHLVESVAEITVTRYAFQP